MEPQERGRSRDRPSSDASLKIIPPPYRSLSEHRQVSSNRATFDHVDNRQGTSSNQNPILGEDNHPEPSRYVEISEVRSHINSAINQSMCWQPIEKYTGTAEEDLEN